MRRLILPLLGIFTAGMLGCESSPPNTPTAQRAMEDNATLASERIQSADPALQAVMNNSYGYVIFPDVGEAAFGVGGASGTGIVYRNGERIGTVTMSQASLGFQLGGQTFAEIILFQDEKALNRLLNDSVEFGGDVTATIIKKGAAAGGQFSHGVQVYIQPKGGLMAGIAVNGQKFHFTPDQVRTTTETRTETESK